MCGLVDLVCEGGGGEVVTGMRFTLVRPGSADIPDIPTSGMLLLDGLELPGGLLGPFYAAGFKPASLLVQRRTCDL